MTEKYLAKKAKYPTFLENANNQGYSTVTECICDLYQKKQTSKQISDLLGLYPGAVLNVLRQCGIKTRGRSRNEVYASTLCNFKEMDRVLFKNVNESETLKRLGYTYYSEALSDLYYKKRLTIEDIANVFDSTIGTISYRLNKMCQPLREKGGKTYSKMTDDLKEKAANDFKTIEPSFKNIQQYCLEQGLNLSPKTLQRFLKTVIY